MKISTTIKLFVLALLGFSLMGAVSVFFQLDKMVSDGRVVNYSGIVRGASQRLVKLELAGQPSDKLISRLDGIIKGLIDGDPGQQLPGATDREFLDKIKAVEKAWAGLKGTIISARSDKTKQDSLLKESEAFFELNNAAVSAAEKFSKSKVVFLKTIQIALFALSSIILAAIWTISREKIIRPIGEGVAVMDSLSRGDLTVGIDVRSRDEMGLLLLSMKNMTGKLKGIISQNKESSSQVSIAADQIAGANQDFSERISKQAASIEETSATMEEMSASIMQTAESTKMANALAGEMSEAAKSGVKVMAATIEAMDDINGSSSKIANISKVIDEIAFQTNLLALNAAEEAARAGEHGKGFAVVASEIRSLAQRASQSAREIAGLIEQSLEKTERGVQLSHDLSGKLEDTILKVRKVTDILDEVTAAAQEQSIGIEQINKAIAGIDQATQQNASLVEETSAAAEELAAEARGLKELVSFFRTEEAAASSVPSSRRTSAVKKCPPGKHPVAETRMTAEKMMAAAKDVKTNGDFEEF